MLKFAPDPNTAGAGFNYIYNSPTRENNDRYLARGDYNVTDKDRIMVRYWQANHGPYQDVNSRRHSELRQLGRIR